MGRLVTVGPRHKPAEWLLDVVIESLIETGVCEETAAEIAKAAESAGFVGLTDDGEFVDIRGIQADQE